MRDTPILDGLLAPKNRGPVVLSSPKSSNFVRALPKLGHCHELGRDAHMFAELAAEEGAWHTDVVSLLRASLI